LVGPHHIFKETDFLLNDLAPNLVLRTMNLGTSADMDSLVALDALLKLNAATNEQHQMMDHSRVSTNLSETIQRSIFNGSLGSVYPPSAASSVAARLVSAQQSLLTPTSPSSAVATATAALNRAADMLSWGSTATAVGSVGGAVTTSNTGNFLTSVGHHQFSPSQLAAVQAAAGLQQQHDRLVASCQLSQRLHQAVEEERRMAVAANAVAAAAAANVVPSSRRNSTIKRTTAAISDSSTSGAGTETDRILLPREDCTTSMEVGSSAPSIDRTLSGEAAEAVRAEKVEEALRSKSQRGKKREDLSEKERVELTRTRNREHAKSTRYGQLLATLPPPPASSYFVCWLYCNPFNASLSFNCLCAITVFNDILIYALYGHRIRKKARYQELLDCETRLEEIHEADKLQADRLARIQQFLTIRGIMLTNELSIHSTAAVAMSTMTETTSEDTSDLLHGIVNPDGQFLYEINDLNNGGNITVMRDFNFRDGATNKDSSSNHSTPFEESLSRMSNWDKRVRARVAGARLPGNRLRGKSGSASSLSVKYEIEGGVNGIAISNDCHAYLRARLVCCEKFSARSSASSSSSTTLLTGLLVVQFESKSSLVATATWTTIHDDLPITYPSWYKDTNVVQRAQGGGKANDETDTKFDDSSSTETLGTQLVHPSVVSLDPEKASMDAEDSHGPGMDIS
jgi:hypothetical protein